MTPRQVRPIPLGKSFPTAKLNTTSISIRAPSIPQLNASVTPSQTPVSVSGGATVAPGRGPGVGGTALTATNLHTTRIIQLQQPATGTTQQIIGSAARLAGNVMLQPFVMSTTAAAKMGKLKSKNLCPKLISLSLLCRNSTACYHDGQGAAFTDNHTAKSHRQAIHGRRSGRAHNDAAGRGQHPGGVRAQCLGQCGQSQFSGHFSGWRSNRSTPNYQWERGCSGSRGQYPDRHADAHQECQRRHQDDDDSSHDCCSRIRWTRKQWTNSGELPAHLESCCGLTKPADEGGFLDLAQLNARISYVLSHSHRSMIRAVLPQSTTNLCRPQPPQVSYR